LDREKHFLGHVLRLRIVAEHAPHVAVHPVEVGLVEGLQGAAVPLAQPLAELTRQAGGRVPMVFALRFDGGYDGRRGL
jgi:hypothetical protein